MLILLTSERDTSSEARELSGLVSYKGDARARYVANMLKHGSIAIRRVEGVGSVASWWPFDKIQLAANREEQGKLSVLGVTALLLRC